MESSIEVLMAAEEKMDKCVEFLHHELSGLRTGKASPGLVENITVEYYGTAARLRDIANISTPEPRLLVISPFDPSSLGAIEKAISAALAAELAQPIATRGNREGQVSDEPAFAHLGRGDQVHRFALTQQAVDHGFA